MINFVIILSFFCLGFIAQRLIKFPTKLPMLLNQLVINISIPAVILLRIPHLKLSTELLFPMIAAWLTVGVASVLVLLIGKKFNWSKPVIGALMMTAVLGNTSYLGFPMVKLFYGEALLPYAIIFDQLGNFIALAIYGTLIISLYSNNEQKPTALTILSRIIRFPPFITLIIALMIPVTIIPTVLNSIFIGCAGAMVPLTMFIVGLQFQLRLDPHYRLPLAYGIAIKMVITPLIILLFSANMPVATHIIKVSVFESAMPPMVTAGVLAMHANLAPKLASAMVGFGLFISFIFLPLFYWLMPIVLS